MITSVKVWKLEYEGELDITEQEGAQKIVLRIKIYSQNNVYRVRIFRCDSFRIQPTFPLSGSRTQASVADHEWDVLDDNFLMEDFTTKNIHSALELVLQRIMDRF